MDGIFMKHRLEFSLALALAATLLCCAFAPHTTLRWWSVAFSPLCDGILTSGTASGEIVLKSRLLEVISQLLH